MSQVYVTRTPNGSPERSRSPRRESPLTMRYRNSRSPSKSPIRNHERRRSTLMGSSGTIPMLSRSNSLQQIPSGGSFTTGSPSSHSNSGSPLKNLVDNMDNIDKLSPLRKRLTYSPTRYSPTPRSPIRAVEKNNISFTFFEEEDDDRVSILSKYSGRNPLNAPLDHENTDPSETKTKASYQTRSHAGVFKELNRHAFKGSITDPKTNETIYLDEK